MKRILFLALAAAASLHAQTDQTIIDRAQQPAPPQAPSSTSDRKIEERGDLDGGTQRLAETRKLPFKLTFAYDLQVYFTDNVFLQPTDKVDAVIVANTLAARIEGNSIPVGQGLLIPSLGLVYQRYNHDLFGNDQTRQNLDFDAYSAPAVVRYRFGDNWEVSAGVTPTAVYGHEPNYDLTYKSISTYVGARKWIAVAKNQIVSLGAAATYYRTDADTPSGPLGFRDDRNDKIDYAVDASYYYIAGAWSFGPYARLVYSDYLHFQEGAFTDVDRRDITGSLGASANYSLAPWASARVFASYDWRNPQGEAIVDYGYQAANIGVGATLSIGF